MKSPFSWTALILGIIVFVPALLITIATLFHASESNPLAIITFMVALISNIPEMPIGSIIAYTGFPVVLPTLTIASGLWAIKKGEPKKKWARIGIELVIASIVAYILLGMIF